MSRVQDTLREAQIMQWLLSINCWTLVCIHSGSKKDLLFPCFWSQIPKRLHCAFYKVSSRSREIILLDFASFLRNSNRPRIFIHIKVLLAFSFWISLICLLTRRCFQVRTLNKNVEKLCNRLPLFVGVLLLIHVVSCKHRFCRGCIVRSC